MGRNPNWATAALGALILAAAAAWRPAHSQSFVYKGCSQEVYAERGEYQSNLNSLLSSLLSYASTVGFYNASVGQGADAVYGLYQCRGDLPSADCAACVRNAEAQAAQICADARGARVQLQGCFLHYDATNFFGQPDTFLIYKACSPRTAADAYSAALRGQVLANLQAGGFNGTGFRLAAAGAGTDPLRGLAQCEGDLAVADCEACISAAVQKLRDLCSASLDGQVYLTKCYARYGRDLRFDDPVSDDDDDDDGGDDGDDAGKTIAIIVGLLAAVALSVVFLSFLRMLFRKQYYG